MALSIDLITIGVPDPEAARGFYTSALAGDDQTADLDLHGTGKLALHQTGTLAGEAGTDPVTSGFRGCVLSVIVKQPDEVEFLLDAATAHGATVVKPAKKQLFGEFTAVYRAPDGTVWKLAAATKKNTAPVTSPITPVETAVYLGVAKPSAAKAFYQALGMTTDRDYGDKFIDFTIAPGVSRLGLLPRKALAKDAGVDERGNGFSGVVLAHTAASRQDLDALLKTADAAGGRITAPVTQNDRGDHIGHFADPDGHHWRITAPA
ncbi:VOC family protein [Amycolatopsis magusensis]|uniref:Glyoxalase superfamily protein PhnB n=1 Tax=Amycolatopsis magusensis TaxID=882444 RepID=A0ABS4PX48_9PSEU|nr:VOC family protein [Amycolatopsis magusensis]MBP2184009.1 putative glyoxalase superfamily protein PhnB [Amycolatopsis magusensis]